LGSVLDSENWLCLELKIPQLGIFLLILYTQNCTRWPTSAPHIAILSLRS
jgi:hypothetical protein